MARASGRSGFRGGFKSGAAGGRRTGGNSGYGGGPKGSTRNKSSSGNKGAGGNGSGKKVVAYSLYDAKGKRTYIGTTNNPSRRRAEHAKSGKLDKGGSLVVESPRLSRSAAQRLESKKLTGYRRRTGSLPRGNKTPDGQFRLF